MAEKSRKSDCDIIIAAAGSSKRFSGRTRKQYHKIGGIPVIVHTVKAMMKHFRREQIIIAAPHGGTGRMSDILAEFGISGVRIIAGGEERAVSVMNALSECRRKYVLIHDGARPYVPSDMIKRIIAAEQGPDCCVVPFIRPHETVRKIEGGSVKTIDRNALLLIQTPQMFHTEAIKRAAEKFIRKKKYFTDDAQYIIENGGRIEFVEGDRRNMKITTKEDAEIMSIIIKAGK